MNINDIMSSDVVTLTMDDTLSTIHDLFKNANFHHLLVTENNVLYGVISDRDLFKSMSPFAGTDSELPRDAAIMNKRAHQIMTRKPVTITADSTIPDAIDLLLKHGVSCLPVVDEDNKIEGIVSWKDLIKATHQEQK